MHFWLLALSSTLADSTSLGSYRVLVYTFTEGDSLVKMEMALVDSAGRELLRVSDPDYPLLFLDPSTGGDVDGDGFPDLVVVATSPDGRAKTLVYSITAAGPKEVRVGLPDWAVLFSFDDLNGDGLPEVLARDTRFDDLGAKDIIVVFRKAGAGYEEDPEPYADFYEGRLSELLGKLRKAEEGERVGLAISYALTLYHMGKADLAWRELERLSGDPSLVLKVKERLLF